MHELPGGIRRLTFPLPLGIGHVHCYLLPGSDGWTLVDTGLGLPDAAARWGPVLELDVAGRPDRRSRTSTPTTPAAARTRRR